MGVYVFMIAGMLVYGFTGDMTMGALLAYIGNRLMAELPGVTVNLESPAYTQWKSSLSTLPSPTALPSPAPSAMPTPAPSPS